MSHSRLVKFSDNDLGQNAYDAIRNELLQKVTSERAEQVESEWLYEIQHTATPRIRKALQESLLYTSHGSIALSTVPLFYTKVLTMLREIVESGKWPTTSVARSAVIHDVESSSRGGSFTVVNPNLFPPNATKPLGNVLFPALAECIFELEQELSNRSFDCERRRCSLYFWYYFVHQGSLNTLCRKLSRAVYRAC